MATSGSTDWNPTRNQLIKSALRKISSLDSHNPIEANELADAAFTLNAMVKEWMGRGIDLWLRREVTLFLANGTTSYSLGSTAHFTESYVETTIRIAGDTPDTTVEVTSTAGMTVADNIGFEMDDNTIHWTTIATIPDSDTLTIDTALPSPTAVGSKIYAYTTKAGRPQKIFRVLRRSKSDIDTQIDVITRGDYHDLSDKSASGAPTQVVYDPQLSAGVLRVWPVDTNDTHKLVMVVRDIVEDFDNAADTAEFPVEWANAIIWNLALELSGEYPVDAEKLALVSSMAQDKYRALWEYDVEEGSTYFGVDTMGYG